MAALLLWHAVRRSRPWGSVTSGGSRPSSVQYRNSWLLSGWSSYECTALHCSLYQTGIRLTAWQRIATGQRVEWGMTDTRRPQLYLRTLPTHLQHIPCYTRARQLLCHQTQGAFCTMCAYTSSMTPGMNSVKPSHWASWVKFLTLYSGDVKFESRYGNRLYWIEYLCGFVQSLQATAGTVPCSKCQPLSCIGLYFPTNIIRLFEVSLKHI